MSTAFSLAILALLALGGGLYAAGNWRRRQRRERLLSEPMPEECHEALCRAFPRYGALPPDLQREVGGVARVLSDEKNFEPCGGLVEVTPEMKLLIAAQAALLIVRLPERSLYFPSLGSILVYPGAFVDRGERRFDLSERDPRGELVGESWDSGSVILSWDSVLVGAANADDGMNVVIHEFAHQLDQLDGVANGVPILRDRDAYGRWEKVFSRSYEAHVEEVETRSRSRKRAEEPPLIDPYGATDPAEFFAVASETFFEEAQDLREAHPDLYAELKAFYGLDPATWPPARRPR